MSGFYCLLPRVWKGERLRRAAERSGPDPYSPFSPGYRERARETTVEFAPGMTLISLGEPTKRLAGAPQPVNIGSSLYPKEGAAGTTLAQNQGAAEGLSETHGLTEGCGTPSQSVSDQLWSAPAPPPAAGSKAPQEKGWRSGFGLSRDG